jgi:hypothetical protein
LVLEFSAMTVLAGPPLGEKSVGLKTSVASSTLVEPVVSKRAN